MSDTLSWALRATVSVGFVLVLVLSVSSATVVATDSTIEMNQVQEDETGSEYNTTLAGNTTRIDTGTQTQDSIETSSGDLTISGSFKYEHKFTGQLEGGWGAKVKVIDDDPIDNDVLKTVYVQQDGSFSATIDESTIQDNNDDGDLDLFLKFETSNGNVQVMDTNANPLGNIYSWRYPNSGTVSKGTGDSWSVGEIEANGQNESLHILRNGMRGWHYTYSNTPENYKTSQVSIVWEDGRSLQGPAYCGAYMVIRCTIKFQFSAPIVLGSEIHIDDDSAWMEDTILHEYGHHVMHSVYGYLAYTSSGCNGLGGHVPGCKYGKEAGWAEGWATFFSTAVQDDAGYIPLPTNTGIENYQRVEFKYNGQNYDFGVPTTDRDEGSINGALWDLYDTGEDDRDVPPDLDGDGTWDGASTSQPSIDTQVADDEISSDFATIWEAFKATETSYSGPQSGEHVDTMREFYNNWLDQNNNEKELKETLFLNGIDYDNQAPNAEISTSGGSGGPLTVSASASDPDNNVEQVIFRIKKDGTVEGEKIDKDGSDGWSKDFSVSESGEWTAIAVPVDEIGKMGEKGTMKTYVSPSSPANPSPSDGASGVGTGTALSWDSPTSSATYDVYLEAGDTTPDQLVSDGQSDTNYEPTLEQSSTYYWQVVAKGPNGQEAQSPVWSFETVSDDSGPTAPSNPTPESSATGIATSTTLSWDASTYDEYFFYDIYFGTSSDPSYYASKDGTSVDVGGLQQGETYYWRVVANGGTQETSSPTWSFDTSSGSGDISIKNPQFRNEERDGPLAISGPYSLDEGYLEYTDKTTVDHDNEYDLRVINDRGIVVSTKEDEAYDGEDSATKLDMDDGEASIFRTPGTHSAEIILHAHRSGETYSTTKATEVEVQKSDNDMSVLPANPKVGETVSADVSHISQDSGETPIEGYEWTVIKNPDGDTEFVKEVSGPNKDEISFTPSEAAEYEIVASDSSNYNGYVIDDVDFQVRSSLPEPSLSVDGFSAPSTATAGETFSAEVDLTNSGDATANYIIRFKANGNIHEVEAANEDPQDSRTERGEFTLPAGTHEVKAVVIDSHNNKHAGPELTETVTVEENTQPDEPTITSPPDGASDLTRQPTLEWSASDPDGDTLTYDIRLEKGDSSPDNTVQTGVTSSSLTPSQLDYGSTYYWQVVAKDEHGASNTGPVWQFTTEPEPNRPPTASVDATPSNPAVGEFVELDATGSSDPNGDPLDYDWTIQSSPEGTSPSLTSGNAITSFLASEPGIYEIELTVNDPSGLEDTVTTTVGTTDKTAPTAEAGSDITTSEGNTVNFNGGLSSDNVGIVSYEWDFDDGDAAAGRTPSHVYPNPGEYTVELTVTDAAGNTDTDTLTVTVEENTLPTASFEYSPSTPTVSDTVSFNASESNDPDGSIQSYEWDFGDGITATATGSKSSYSYDSPGNYTIELTVTDGNGATDTDRMNITVEEEPEDTVDNRRELGRGESEDADLDDRRDQSRSEDRDIDRRRGSGRGGEREGDRGQSR